MSFKSLKVVSRVELQYWTKAIHEACHDILTEIWMFYIHIYCHACDDEFEYTIKHISGPVTLISQKVQDLHQSQLENHIEISHSTGGRQKLRAGPQKSFNIFVRLNLDVTRVAEGYPIVKNKDSRVSFQLCFITKQKKKI